MAVQEPARVRPNVVVESTTRLTTRAPIRLHRIEITARTFFTLLLVMATCWALVKLTPVILMIVASLMLVGALNPVVERLEARGWRRCPSIGAVFSVLVLVAVLLGTLTLPALLAQGAELMEREPALREQLAQWLSERRVTAPLAESLRRVKYGALLGDSTQLALRTSIRTLEILAYAVGAIFLSLYVMLDRDRLRGALFALVPRTHHIPLSRVLLNLERIVGGYIRGQVITSALMVVFMFVLLRSVGAESALAIAVFAGLMDVLPYIGGLLMLVPALLTTLPMGPVVALTVLGLIVVYQELENRLLIPLLYGRSLRLPSSVVLVALLAGGVLYGVVGALLALPVAAAALMLLEELRVELPGETETPDKEKQREADVVNEQEYTARTEGLPAQEAAAVALEMTDGRTKDEAAAAEEAAAVAAARGVEETADVAESNAGTK